MGKNLNQLGLKAEQIAGVDFDHLPEQMGGWAPPPPEGSYRFELPKNLTDCWDVFDTDRRGQRVRAEFDRDHPLVIVQSKQGAHDGEPFETRISNAERNRARKGQAEVLASDMDYLLRALKETAKPKTNQQYIQALQRHAGQQFGGDIEYSWVCSEQRKIRVDDGAGGTTEIEQMGCGSKYYSGDVPLENGARPYRITCSGNGGQCGAVLRAFANLTRFRE